MKLRPPTSVSGRWALVLTMVLAILAGAGVAIAIAIQPSEPATSEEENPVARFDITPLPFTPYPATVEPPDPSKAPRCQAPAEERPAPDLPPLPCHYSGAEPPAGTIPTPAPGEHLDPRSVPAGWQVVDNPMFRFTLAIPPGWYVNMRPEGGEFYLLDAVSLEEEAKGQNLPGGVVMHFTAQVYVRVQPPFTSPLDAHLDAPNVTFGSYEGAVWDEPPEEGLARNIWAAFLKDGVVFTVLANIGIGGAAPELEGDVVTVREILGSITPY